MPKTSAPTDVNATGKGTAATADRPTERVFTAEGYDGSVAERWAASMRAPLTALLLAPAWPQVARAI